MQQCAIFVCDLFYVMFSKKHNDQQQGQADVHLVFSNSHESERIKGFPSVSYLRALSVYRWEKL